jgi:hypothetical protein
MTKVQAATTSNKIVSPNTLAQNDDDNNQPRRRRSDDHHPHDNQSSMKLSSTVSNSTTITMIRRTLPICMVVIATVVTMVVGIFCGNDHRHNHTDDDSDYCRPFRIAAPSKFWTVSTTIQSVIWMTAHPPRPHNEQRLLDTPPRWLHNPFDVQDRTNNENQQRDDNLFSMNEQQQQRRNDPIQLYNSDSTWTMAMMHHHWLVEYRRVWSTAFLAAAHDSMVAIRSGSILFYLTVSPMIQFLYFILSYVICQKIIYEIIITILSPQLLRQLQWIVTYGIAWQLSCTRQQLMMEVGLVVSFVGIYVGLQYLQKHQYLTRMKVRYEKSVQSIQKVRCLLLLLLLL